MAEYRDLTEGEVIQKDDEWLCATANAWFQTLRAGAVCGGACLTRYRRRVKNEIDPGEGLRALHEGEIIQKGDEFFGGSQWHSSTIPGTKVGALRKYRRRVEKEIDPGEGWRAMHDGEIIQKGDEYYEKDLCQWLKAGYTIGTELFKGGDRWRRRVYPPAASDPVNSPPHYNKFPVEVIQIIRHLIHNRGAAVGYICRAGVKDPTTEVQDLKKAIWYLEDEIQRLTGEGSHAKP